MHCREVTLTDEVLTVLLDFSRAWEAENSCAGYRANTREDIEGRRIFLAFDNEIPVGYCFGHPAESKNMTSIMPDGTPFFDVDELYVIPALRSKGIGRTLFSFMEEQVKQDVSMILLSTATRNARAILHFYLEEVGMEFWSATLFKRL